MSDVAEKLSENIIRDTATAVGVALSEEDVAYISAQFEGFSVLENEAADMRYSADEILYHAQSVGHGGKARCDLRDLVSDLHAGRATSLRVTEDCFERMTTRKDLNNFISENRDAGIAAAKRADVLLASGRGGELCGVPIAVKDNINVKGLPVTCASRIFSEAKAASSAECVKRIEEAGGVIVGKTNMDELAMGSTDESSAFGAVKNALDITRVPGGSSGGSANAVAARQAVCALGTDTGGSIRQPAAYCGVVGLKPTFGAVSCDGLVGFVPSLDTIGVLAPDCDSAGIVFGVMSGRKLAPANAELFGKTIGIADEFASGEIASDEVRKQFENAIAFAAEHGARIVRVRLPSFTAALAAYHVLSSAEAATNILASVPKNKLASTGGEVRRRIVAGVLAGGCELYEKARNVRERLCREYAEAFGYCDVLLSPTSPTTATVLGASRDPNKSHYGDYFLAPASLAGLPAASVPFGDTVLPVGIHIVGNYGCEQTVLDIGSALEYKAATK